MLSWVIDLIIMKINNNKNADTTELQALTLKGKNLLHILYHIYNATIGHVNNEILNLRINIQSLACTTDHKSIL